MQTLSKKKWRGVWKTAIEKYSQSAHFIYELLQNADDANATNVRFELEEKGLWFEHNGTEHFTITDDNNIDEDSAKGCHGHINAITSMGLSNKVDEQKKLMTKK